MTGGAVLKAALAGVPRLLVQTMVIFAVLARPATSLTRARLASATSSDRPSIPRW
jgi:hypothetical protein